METMKESPDVRGHGRALSVSLALTSIEKDLPWPVLPT
jgi:hypothetical protein